MSGQTFIDRDLATGLLTQKASAQASTGVSDAGRVVALDAAGQIDASMLANAQPFETAVAGEALTTNDLIAIKDVSGTPTMFKAKAAVSGQLAAEGYVTADYAMGDSAKMYKGGKVAGQTGLTAGARMYLSETAGAATATVVSGTGKIHQFVGKAISATEFDFNPDDVIVLA